MKVEGVVNQIQTDVNSEKHKALKEACQQFESIFVNMMFQRMRATIPESGFVENRFESSIYKSMFDEEMARLVSGAGGIGLANQLYEQLSKNL
jgi:flagellar protein FlgJ